MFAFGKGRRHLAPKAVTKHNFFFQIVTLIVFYIESQFTKECKLDPFIFPLKG